MDCEILSPCPAEFRRASLELTMASIPDDQRGAVLDTLQPLVGQGVDVFAGLAVALSREGALRGAAWLQPQVGRTATLWPPQTVADGAELRRPLAEQALAAGRSLPVDLVQAIVPDDGDAVAAELRALGLVHLADLRYLMRTIGTPEGPPQPAGVRLEAPATADPRLFEQVLMGSYEGTLDCPALEGRRRFGDIIAGYQSIGSYDPSLWFIAWCGDHPAGVLLLAPYPDTRQWELVYMGVLPNFRGRGLGRQMLTAVEARASTAGVAQVVLAVDAANTPAVRVYRQAGFVEWARRAAYIQSIDAKHDA